ncbi:uncharacterized protein LOC134290461 [Aedes albopictus]|uniref:Peptidase aspartic putative domain-containing protein n=1 Tax=Aedes albopictus TaxID=7160 RepID=A0ABM1Y8K6_AEDAL
MTTDSAQRLKCKTFTDYLRIKGVGSSESTSTNAVIATVSPRSPHRTQFSAAMKFHVLSRVTTCLPCKHVNIRHLKLPSNNTLADPGFNVPGPIDMIIGAEHFYELLMEDRRRLEGSEAVIQKTVFGWIVSGVVEINLAALPQVVSNVNLSEAESTRRIQEQLARFWELETCHVKSTLSIEESACEELFKKTTFRDEAGRFVVSLPKKPDMIGKLGESRSIAVKRFLGLERRLEANPEVKAMYVDFVHEYLLMGHMVKVEELIEDPPAYFLPHHAVIKPDSTTTKLRVVFDASCLTSTGISLNDALMVGPVVQDELYDINIRFRLHIFVVVADVAKMYRMVNMAPADQQYQMIVWRGSPKEPIHSYKLTIVTYGTASAPYLATKCLQTLAEDGTTTHPIGSKVVKKDFYVDDMLSGADSIEEAKQLVAETIDLTNSAGFILRKWRSNSDEVLKGLPAHLRDDGGIKELESSNTTIKTLGMLWDSTDDCYRFKVPQWNAGSTISKRVVLSDTARIFDPLGLVGPIVVTAKIFLQDLWKEQVEWDEPLSEELQNRWLEYRRNLISLESITVPRWVGCNPKCIEVEVHGFSDASEKAYGACLYMRSVWEDDTIAVFLLTSKSKVAPLEDLKRKKKKQTVPRLELSGALLMSHLIARSGGMVHFGCGKIIQYGPRMATLQQMIKLH